MRNRDKVELCGLTLTHYDIEKDDTNKRNRCEVGIYSTMVDSYWITETTIQTIKDCYEEYKRSLYFE